MAFSWKSTVSPDEIYVILGNGFDLECGLHTAYGDFLTFVRDEEYKTPTAHTIPAHAVDWQALHEHNYWFKRFESIRIGSGWVDFENEIARVVTIVERSMICKDGSQAFIDDDIGFNRDCWSTSILSILSKIYDALTEDGITAPTYRDLMRKLLNDLSDLTVSLEAYLYDYVCKRRPKPTGAIGNLVKQLFTVTEDRVRVISFNYTRTLENILSGLGISPEFCYVHGTIGDGTSKNNMVLGIDEHLDSAKVSKFVEFGPFRKYNQRIYKQTDSRYMSWVREAHSLYEHIRQLNKRKDDLLLSPSYDSPNMRMIRDRIAQAKESAQQRKRRREVIIFGHSLGITDKDILKSFITLPDTRTVVYHHDEASFSEQVSNMTAILGMDEVIDRTGGEERTLEFRNQYKLS